MLRLLSLAIASFLAPAAASLFVAPAPPVLTDNQRLAELQSRRAKLLEQVGPRGILLLLSGEERTYTGDVGYPYREENNFYYLTGVQQSGAVLLLIPGAISNRELLFLPIKTRSAEIFTGSVVSIEQAKSTSGIPKILDMKQLPAILGILSPQISLAITTTGLAEQGQSPISQSETDGWAKAYEPFIKAIKGESADLFLFLPPRTGDVEYRREQALASALSSTSAGFSIHNAQPLLRKARLIKSPHEIALIQHAIDITAEGFERAWSVAAPDVHEYDLQAEFDYTYTRRRARFGYPSIIGGGLNGTTLHYEENRDVLEAGSLIVMDAGAEYDNYSADVTRTIPASGKFTPEQALIYRLVYAAQQAAIASAHSGQAIGSVLKKDSGSFSGTAVDVLRKGLTVMGVMTDKDSDEQLRLWLPHGISHQLGMNVHDISKQGLEFSPGMVVTIEPGLYFRPDALDALPRNPENAKIIAAVRPAFERFKGIGIRIEDDILITEGGPKVLSAAIPSKLEDVEASLLRLRSLRPTL